MQLFSSPCSTNPDMFAALVARLGGAEAIEALARRHSAFHRARHIKSAADLLRLILAYAPGGRSLRRLAAEAAATGGGAMFPMSPFSHGFVAAAIGSSRFAKTCWRAAMSRRAGGWAKMGSASST